MKSVLFTSRSDFNSLPMNVSSTFHYIFVRDNTVMYVDNDISVWQCVKSRGKEFESGGYYSARHIKANLPI